MRRPHPDLLLSLLALAAVGTLSLLAHTLEPPLVALGDVAEGARVAVEARILDTRGRWTMLSDGTHRLAAFLPRSANVERGDTIRGEGVVSRNDDGLVLSLDELVVTLPAARLIREPAELAAAPWEFDRARVVVAGEVRAPHLVGGGARVRLAGDAAPTEGDVIVTGMFRYHEADASFVVWVESWTSR